MTFSATYHPFNSRIETETESLYDFLCRSAYNLVGSSCQIPSPIIKDLKFIAAYRSSTTKFATCHSVNSRFKRKTECYCVHLATLCQQQLGADDVTIACCVHPSPGFRRSRFQIPKVIFKDPKFSKIARDLGIESRQNRSFLPEVTSSIRSHNLAFQKNEKQPCSLYHTASSLLPVAFRVSPFAFRVSHPTSLGTYWRIPISRHLHQSSIQAGKR